MATLEETVRTGGVYRLPVVLRDGEDGYIIATCPVLPGTITQGRTREEALANIREAIILALESAEEEGWTPPTRYAVERVEVSS
jgi:predicted RNase H-like HicB family nuclease